MIHKILTLCLFFLFLFSVNAISLPGEKFTIAGQEFYNIMPHTQQIDLKKYGKNFSIEFTILPQRYDSGVSYTLLRFLKNGRKEPNLQIKISSTSIQLNNQRSLTTSSFPNPIRFLHFALACRDGILSLYVNGKPFIPHILQGKLQVDQDQIIFGPGSSDSSSSDRLLVKDLKIHADPEEIMKVDPPKDPKVFAAQEAKYKAVGITVGHYVPAPNRHVLVSGDPVDDETLKKSASFLYDVLDSLPVEFIRKSGLKKVYIMDNLKSGNQHCEGCAAGESIWLKPGVGAKTFFHEFFHIYAKKCNILWDIPTNPPDFKYKFAWKTEEEKKKNPGKFQQNFVSSYSMTSGGEDRSEVFCFMMLEGPRFPQRAKENLYIRKKMDAVIRICLDIGGTDEAFWANFLEDDSFIAREAARKAQQIKKYADIGITIDSAELNDPENGITCQKIDDEKTLTLKRASLLDIWDILPLKFIQKTGIKKVLLVKDLLCHEKPCSGMIFQENSLLLNGNDINAKLVYSHLWRLFDVHNANDAEWLKTNPPGSQYYGDMTAKELQQRRSNDKDFSRFFLHLANNQAGKDSQTDRAETFAAMMTRHIILKNRIEHSEFFRKKTAMIMALTQGLIDRESWLKYMNVTEDELAGIKPPQKTPPSTTAGKKNNTAVPNGKKSAVPSAGKKNDSPVPTANKTGQ